jgi:RND family efflux transporter MFP subunit
VESDQNTMVTARQPGFVINNVLVKAGDNVAMGQLMCTVDNSTILQNKEAMNVQYALAKTAFERQKNLWDKHIGSEIQYLQAKTQKEALEKQMLAIDAQIANTNVVAPFSGTVESVNFKVGDNTASGMGGIRVVNNSRLKITAKLADTYISKVHRGDKVKIVIPDLGNKEIEANLTFVANTISSSRTFEIQVMLVNSTDLKPNMNANLKINDATFPKVFVLTENMVQSSEGQKSIYLLIHDGSKTIAKRTIITTGESYGGLVVVKGLKEGDEVITTGYSGINDGEEVKL